MDLDVVTGALKGWGAKGLPFGTLLHASPPRRQRTLTGPLPAAQHPSFWQRIPGFAAAETEQSTHSQAQCHLLARLPLDVRILIYEMVLGGMDFHIGTSTSDSSGRMKCFVCRRPRGIADANHQECLAPADRRRSSASILSPTPTLPRTRTPDHPAPTLLPLLLTCRQIYSEAIPTLYASNTFEFWQNQIAFRFLKVMIPAHRLPSIRRFRWAMQFPHHPAVNARSQRDWADLFAFFADDMYGLRHLHLQLKRNYPVEAIIRQTPDEQAVGWIRPILLMAVDAWRKRGCQMEIVTNGVVHEPVGVYQGVVDENPDAGYGEVLQRACAELHRRIRVSLDEVT